MAGPQRIVSLLSSATEILFALGAGDHVIGVSHECDYPPAAKQITRLTSSYVNSQQASRVIDEDVKQRSAAGTALYAINGELLAELAPDLIITQSQCDVCAVRYEDVIGLTAAHASLRNTRVLALNPMSLDDVFEDVRRIGQAIDRAAAARQYVDALQHRVASIHERTRALDRPRVVCIEWIDPLMLAANWTPQLVELAGGENGLTVAGRHSTYAAWSEVVRYDPQVMIVSPCGFDLPRTQEEAAALPLLADWHGLAAVRDHRVFAVDGNAYLNRSGPRLVDSLEILAHLFHPYHVAPPASVAAPHEAWCAL